MTAEGAASSPEYIDLAVTLPYSAHISGKCARPNIWTLRGWQSSDWIATPHEHSRRPGLTLDREGVADAAHRGVIAVFGLLGVGRGARILRTALAGASSQRLRPNPFQQALLKPNAW